MEPPVVLSRPDAEPRIRTWDADKKDWVWVRPRRLAPSPLSAVMRDSDSSSRPPTPPPKSPRHVARPAEAEFQQLGYAPSDFQRSSDGRQLDDLPRDALPPGAAAPALSVQPELAGLGTRGVRRRPATDETPSQKQRGAGHTRTKSLFIRRRDAQPEQEEQGHVPPLPVLPARPASWFAGLGSMLRRKRTSRTPPDWPTPTPTPTPAEHGDKHAPLRDFGPPPPPEAWERAALDAYAALSVRPRGAR